MEEQCFCQSVQRLLVKIKIYQGARSKWATEPIKNKKSLEQNTIIS